MTEREAELKAVRQEGYDDGFSDGVDHVIMQRTEFFEGGLIPRLRGVLDLHPLPGDERNTEQVLRDGLSDILDWLILNSRKRWWGDESDPFCPHGYSPGECCEICDSALPAEGL